MTEETEIDLYYALHDSILRAVRSSVFDHSVTLVIQNVGLSEYYGYQQSAQFEVHFAGVKSLVVIVAHFHAPDQGHEEFIAREESASWTEFERAFDGNLPWYSETSSQQGRYEILNATFARDADAVELIIDDIVDFAGFTSDKSDILSEIRIRACSVEVGFPDGQFHTIEEFNRLGRSYWQHRKPSAQ